jgi:hypothetical protein
MVTRGRTAPFPSLSRLMTRTIPIKLMTREWGERTVHIKPHWAGKGIAIHKPVTIADDGQPMFRQLQGYWTLTHINTGLRMGACMGSLDRAKGFAKPWDAEFAALQCGEEMAPDQMEAWGRVVEEMKIEPPRKPPAPRVRRGAVIAAIEAGA